MFNDSRKEISTLKNGMVTIEEHFDPETGKKQRTVVRCHSSKPNVFTQEDGDIEIRFTGQTGEIDVLRFGKISDKLISPNGYAYGYWPTALMKYIQEHYAELMEKATEENQQK